MTNGINGIDDFLKLFYNAKADKNNDGSLDKKEGALFLFSDEAKSVASAYSAGKISEEEFQKWEEEFLQNSEEKQSLAEKIADFDTNNNGFIQLNEIQDESEFSALKNIFSGTQETFSIEELMAYKNLVDTNDDGIISDEEKNRFGSLVFAEKVGSYSKTQVLTAIQKSIHSEDLNNDDETTQTYNSILNGIQDESIFNLEQSKIEINETEVNFQGKSIILKDGETAIKNDDGSVDIMAANGKTGIRYDSNGNKIGTLTKTFTKGILTKEELKKTDGSTIAKLFDSKTGKITKETTTLKNKKVKETTVYKYAKNGSLSTVTVTKNDNNGKLQSTTVNTYNTAGTLTSVKVTNKDKSSTTTTFAANGDKTVEKKNAKNKTTSKNVYYANGTAKSTLVNSYSGTTLTKSVQEEFDAFGNKTDYIAKTYSKGKLSSSVEYKYNSDGSYTQINKNQNGKITSEKHFDANGVVTEQIQYTYDKAGKIPTKKTNTKYQANGARESVFTETYDAKGKNVTQTTLTEYNENDKPTLTTTQVFDKTFKYISKETLTRYDENGVKSNTLESSKTSAGTVTSTKLTNFNSDGKTVLDTVVNTYTAEVLSKSTHTTYKADGTTADNVTIDEYDADGTTILKTTSTNYKYITVNKKKQQKVDNQTVTTFNTDGTKTEVVTKYSYDKNAKVTGSKIETTTYDADGNVLSKKSTSKDKSNKLISETLYEYANDGSYSLTTKDKTGKITSKEKHNADGTVTTESYKYDKTGKILTTITANTKDQNGNIISTETITYDKTGKYPTQSTLTIKDGDIKLSTLVSTFNANGDTTKTVLTNFKDGTTPVDAVEKNYDTDGKLKTSKHTTYKADGKTVDNVTTDTYAKDGSTITKTTSETYENGQVVARTETTYGENGEISVATATIQNGKVVSQQGITRNADGEVIANSETTFNYDSKGNLTDSVTKEFATDGTYKEINTDANGNITSTKQYDANNNLLSEETVTFDTKTNTSRSELNRYENGSIVGKVITIDDGQQTIRITTALEDKWVKDNSGNWVTVKEMVFHTKEIDSDDDGTYDSVQNLTELREYLPENKILDAFKTTETVIISDRIISDIEIVKAAEQAGLQAGEKDSDAYNQAYNDSIKAQIIKTPDNMTGIAGELVEKEDGLYVNDGKNLVKLNISSETYLELFPPIQRYDLEQGYNLSDCFFAAALNSIIEHPETFSKLLQMFSEDENGNITIRFAGTLSKYPVTFESGEIKEVDGTANGKTYDNQNIRGAKGLVMIEQALAIGRFSRDKKQAIDTIDIDAALSIIDNGGYGDKVYTEMFNSIKKAEQVFGINTGKKLIYANSVYTENFLRQYADKINNGSMLVTLGIEDALPQYGLVTGNHDYSIEKVDYENRILYVNNPWFGGGSIAINFAVLEQITDLAFNYCIFA